MLSFLNQGTIARLKDIKEKLDKYYTIVIGCLWVLATLWDIIRFQCFWSDYMLEIYSCFFIVFMALNILFPSKVPKLINDQFGIINNTLGRGIIMLVFSLLFLGDKHLFHKLTAIFLFIGGALLVILELIAPSDNKSGYPSIGNSINMDGKHSEEIEPDKKREDSQTDPEVLDKTPNDKLPPLEEKPGFM